MVIYKHNLAEKLFGFAYSKEFLRQNTDLCGFVDDPNLSLDIDLAVEFHKALRSDPIAAEKVTNLLILSSSYIDVSTAEFYTDKMKTYPVFDDHINRINDLFFSAENNTEPVINPNALPEDERERYEIGRYINEQLRDSTFVTVSGIGFTSPEQILYERVSLSTGYTVQQLKDISFNSNFNNAFKNALQDCLNSPCNLFSETSDSIASLANQASMMNSTTMPTWGELKKNFFNAIGGVPDTIFKKVPMSIQNSIIELGQIGQQAIEQSTEMFFAKPESHPLDIEGKKSKEKLIQKALAGQSLNSDSQGYKYIPDLDSYLNVTKLSTKILKKAADDLGGCFNKFQQAARYEPFNPEQNKTFTSMDPIGNKVGDTPYLHNTLGKTNNDYKARTTASMSSCDYAEPEAATGSGINNGSDISPITTAYSPQKDGSAMEGDYRSSRPGLDGKSLVRTLDDYNAGTYNYITLAGDPSQYGKTYIIPQITYINKNNQTITLKNVTGYVHDTGSAFRGAGSAKFDIPIGRDYSNSLIDKQPFSQKRTVFNPK